MAPSPLPFFDFLEELRKRGFAVSLAQHQDVARLCMQMDTWPGCDAKQVARSLAALLGRNAHEVVEIERAFFQHYASAYFFKDNAAPLPAGVMQAALREIISRAQLGPRRRRWWLAVGVVLVLVGAWNASQVPDLWRFYGAHLGPLEHRGPEAEKPSTQAPSTSPLESKPTIRNPTLQPAQPIYHRGQQALWVGPGPLLLLLGVYNWRRRRELRARTRQYWRAVRSSLEGLTDFSLKLPHQAMAFSRQDLEDMATVLGRGAEPQGALRLNVPRTVQQTIERAAFPSLVFSRRTVGKSLLVLCDVCADMRPWERKVRALVQGLVRHGVRLEVWYFDGDAARVASEPFGRSISLVQLYRHNPDSSLLVLSSGSRLLDSDEERRRAGKIAPWLEQVRRFRLRAWLHPIADPTRWRPALRRPAFARQYLRVTPLTRAGMLAAAYELAQEPDRRIHISDQSMRPTRVVTEVDVQHMRRLLALYPGAPLELVEQLRQQFYPQIPDDVVLDVLTSSQAMGGRTLRFGDADLARWLSELQREEEAIAPAARTEDRVRRYLLELLAASEPEDKACLGHLKWRLRKAMQQVYLHDPDDRNVDEAVTTLKELVRGPLWEETHGELWALGVPSSPTPHHVPARRIAAPVAARLEREVLTLVAATAGGKVILPDIAAPSGAIPPARPRLLRWPAPAELVPAFILASILIGLVVWRGAGVEHVEHVLGYAMTWKTTDAVLGEVELQVRAQDDQLPAVLQLCSDDVCEGPPGSVKLRVGKGSVRRQLERSDRYLHVQATLPKGNLAYSAAVLLPSHSPLPQATLRVLFENAGTGKAVAGVRYTLTDSVGESHQWEAGQAVAVRIGPVTIHGEALHFRRFSQTEQVHTMDAELKIQLQAETVEGELTVAEEAASVQKTRKRVKPGDEDLPRANARDESPGEEARPEPNMEHMIVIRGLAGPFLIDQREVSVAEYEACINAQACSPTSITQSSCNLWKANKHGHPINCVAWQQAEAYCKWRKKELPTIQQWDEALEYARRQVGTTAQATPCVNRSYSEGTCARTAASGIGVPLDMIGNVAEWTNLPTAAKGSCWADRSMSDVGTMRKGEQITRFFDCIGFRCVSRLPPATRE